MPSQNPIQIVIIVEDSKRPGCGPDVTVTPTQVHVRGPAVLQWTLHNEGTFAVRFKGVFDDVTRMSRRGANEKSVATLEVPGGARPGAYPYAVEGKTQDVGGRDLPFGVPACPAIVID